MSLKKRIAVSLAALAIAGAGSLALWSGGEEENGGETGAGLANPASVYCEEQGGTVRMEEGPEGTVGICVFPDGTEVEEWEYWNRSH
jgi:putative hemolysin